MRLIDILNESQMAINKSVASGVYRFLEKNGDRCRYNDGTNAFVCHESVSMVKHSSELKEYWWYKDLKFHEWNELKWNKVSKRILKDKKRFSNKHINNMLEDIADFSMNGHSFISFNGYFIDPYLKSLGVTDKQIQAFDKYFSKIM